MLSVLSSSGSVASESFNSCNRCREMSSSSSNGGKSILEREKYGITRKAATGRWNTDPSSSDMTDHDDNDSDDAEPLPDD